MNIPKLNKRLDLINKMALLRNGNLPVPVVVLKGHKDNVESVAKKEAEILGKYFHICKGGNIRTGVVNFVPCDVDSSDISWLKCKYEVIDVDTIHLFDWNAFFDLLSLDGASIERFSGFTPEMELALAKNMDQVVTDVLYAHYEKRDDNNLTDADIRMIRNMVSTSKKARTSSEKKELESIEKMVEQSSSQTAEPEKVEHETPIKEEMSPNTENENNMKAADIVQETPDEKQVLESDEDVIPKPKEVKKKKSSFVVKEEVSSEEEKRNNELLQELRILYKSTIQYMTEMCNSQYRIIINKMQEAVDTNVFKQQFTKMYLDLSDDTSSELYRKLYEVDVNTQKFHKEIVHQIKHLGCFNCGTEWDEDITFLEKGPHMVRCPKCYNNYPFEK